MDNNKIIECLDSWLKNKHKLKVSVVEAAEILDKAGLLKNSKSRPGQPLRKKLRNHEIPHAYQIGVKWYIPNSNSSKKDTEENISKATSQYPQNQKNENRKKLLSFDTLLLNRGKFQDIKTLTKNDVPDAPGLYAIRIKFTHTLPEDFKNELNKRNDTLLYIGKATKSLKKRLWEEELHAMQPATFFRSIGAILGFLPPQGSLIGKKNKCNYKFSSHDKRKIIHWIEENLTINFVICEDCINYVEKNLIKKLKPIVNIQNNPEPFKPLVELRKKCRNLANSNL